VQAKWFEAKKGRMSSNVKLNWIISSLIKPWRPHGRKRSVLPLKVRFLAI
jgi:hypothetical protein